MGPLAGLRVVELAAIGPVPYAGMLLADLGAQVVRVDRPDSDRPLDAHRVLDRGRHSVALDLKRPGAVETVLRLVERCDVLVEGFRPGVAERLGVGPEPCRARNPRLVYARMTGWGRTGPLAGTAGHDVNYLARSGLLDALGRAGGPPTPPLNLLGDFAGGALPLVVGILAALYERERSGLGQVVDAAVVDGAASLSGMLLALSAAGQWRPERGTNLLDTGAPFYDVYRCSDGRYVAVGALEEPFYAALLDGLGLDPDAVPDRTDPARWPDLRGVLTRRFATRTRDEWGAVFAGTDACVTPVLSLDEAPDGYVSRDGLRQPKPAPHFSRTPLDLPPPAPEPGQHTDEVLNCVNMSVIADSTMARLSPAALGPWTYHRTFYLLGQSRVYARTRDPRYLGYLKDWVDRFVDADGTLDAPLEDLDSMLGGRLLLLLHQETGDQRYRAAATTIRRRLDTYPRTTDGGFWHKTAYTRQLWADGAYMVSPFLAEYARAYGEATAADEAVHQLTTYAAHLRQPATGLVRHGYDETRTRPWADPGSGVSPEYWGRAVGWFAMALVEVLDALPADHPGRPALDAILGDLAAGIARHQDPASGLWYEVVDQGTRPDNWTETSCSAMFAYVLSRTGPADVAAKGYAGVLAQVSENGDVAGTCTGAAPGFYPYYVDRPRATNDLHGLGAVLVMLAGAAGGGNPAG